MDPRKQRGLELAAIARISQTPRGWRVPSQTTKYITYIVNMDGTSPICTCIDFNNNQARCKHIWATIFTISRERDEYRPAGAPVEEVKAVPKPTYTQNWPAYNAAQVAEKDLFQVLLHKLCSGLRRPEPLICEKGRPRIPLSDAIFSVAFKVYSTLSGRRFMSDLRAAHERGHISQLVSYNSIFNFMRAEETADVLDGLIIESAQALKVLELDFACDSSGFSASRFDRWFDHKYGKHRIRRAWVKTHIMTGVRTNVVTALEIHGQDAHDAPLLPALLDTTVRAGFNVEEVSGDRGYSSIANLEYIQSVGAKPFIAFKNNATDAQGGLWAQMFHYYSLNREKFLSHYHKRSNVETTFHMIKSKFGDSVRSKMALSMANEVRAKVLCHNICCVIQSMHEFQIDPDFGVAA